MPARLIKPASLKENHLSRTVNAKHQVSFLKPGSIRKTSPLTALWSLKQIRPYAANQFKGSDIHSSPYNSARNVQGYTAFKKTEK